MARIGSRKNAAFILNWFEDNYDDYDNVPDGWEYVGSGSYRAVFLHQDSNVTYKVQIMDDDGYNSDSELRAARRLSKKEFRHVRIPATSGYRINGELVIAMEYVDGCHGLSGPLDSYRDALVELFRIGFMDMHEHNFIMDNSGKIVPVDMASPARKGSLHSDMRVLLGLPEYRSERQRRQRNRRYW